MRVLVFSVLIGLVYANLRDVVAGYSNQVFKVVVSEDDYERRYKADWKDLDTRPLPEWYDRAKIGIFLHWGVYSVPSFHSEWFWAEWSGGALDIKKFMQKNYPPGFTYQDFAPMFKAEFFDPDEWASLFVKSGAKYIVLTSKHHEGFTLFPSTRSFSWNSVDVGPKKDLVGALAHAVRAKGLKFGVYHSLYEWFNPLYLGDKKAHFQTRVYPDTKLWPDLKQLIYDYKPSVIWADGDWEAKDSYWNSTDFLAWLYNDSPVKDEIVVNDRWGKGIPCHHGDFYNCDDRYNPGKLQNHKWENAFTVDKISWGYRRTLNLTSVMTLHELLHQVVSTVSCGGNALINVGPTSEGTIIPIFQERLISLGKWLEINGEGIYNTSPWLHQEDSIKNKSDIWYTCTKSSYNAANPTAVPNKGDVKAIYAILLNWPIPKKVQLADIASVLHSGAYKVEVLGVPGSLEWSITKGLAEITLPDMPTMHTTLKFSPK